MQAKITTINIKTKLFDYRVSNATNEVDLWLIVNFSELCFTVTHPLVAFKIIKLCNYSMRVTMSLINIDGTVNPMKQWFYIIQTSDAFDMKNVCCGAIIQNSIHISLQEFVLEYCIDLMKNIDKYDFIISKGFLPILLDGLSPHNWKYSSWFKQYN